MAKYTSNAYYDPTRNMVWADSVRDRHSVYVGSEIQSEINAAYRVLQNSLGPNYKIKQSGERMMSGASRQTFNAVSGSGSKHK